MEKYECCIEYCKKSTNDTSDKQSDILFHRFPVKQSILCAKWIHSIQILANQTIKTGLFNLFVCSKHFSSFDYIKNKTLHPQAIPSIFHSTATDSDCESVEVLYEADANSDIEDENVLRVLNENNSKFFLEDIKVENIDVDDDHPNQSQISWDLIKMDDQGEDIMKAEDLSPPLPPKLPKNEINVQFQQKKRHQPQYVDTQNQNKRKNLKYLFGHCITNEQIAQNPKEAKECIDKLKLALDLERGDAKSLTITLKQRNQKIKELNLIVDGLLKSRLNEFGRCVLTTKK